MSLRNAFAYLTALRIPPRTRVPLVHSLHYFPWLGAAFGSLNILFFLTVSQWVAAPVAALLAVFFPQALAGFLPWRGVMETTQGVRTLPGHGYVPGFRPDLSSFAVVGLIVLAKWVPLLMLPADWQVRAVFVFPILGMCARTFAFMRASRLARLAESDSASGERGKTSLSMVLIGRRIRGGFLSTAQVFLVFLFPLRAALALAVLLPLALEGLLRLRLRQDGKRTGQRAGLTLQSAALVSELAEALFLTGLVLAGLLLYRI